jgi:hypothetical protein
MAMEKPAGFDESESRQESTLFFRPKPGPVTLVIIRLWHDKNKEGEKVMRMLLDIGSGDSKGYFWMLSKQKKKEIFISHYQGMGEKGLPYYKGIMTAIERSNNFKIDWEKDESQFALKKIGANLREEEYYDEDGKIQTSLKPVYFCSVQSLTEKEHPVLPVKRVTPAQSNYSVPVNDAGVPDFTDDDLPF